MTPESERQLIKKVNKGDKDAFEELVLANQKNVYNLALRMTGNPTDAEDISQEVFLKAYRLLSKFRGESRFSVWLYRMTHNLCIDFLRKKKRELTTPLISLNDEENEFVHEIPDIRDLPEDSAIQRELRETIFNSIDELELSQREIIIMREITDMSYTDIAKTLNINEGTVKSRLSRARKSLAKALIVKSAGTFPPKIRHNDEGRVGS